MCTLVERGYSSLVRRKLRMVANREGSLSMKIYRMRERTKKTQSGQGARRSGKKKIESAGAYSSGFILQGGDAAAEEAGDTNIQLLALEVH